jgi:peroxiredoxin
MRLYRLLGTGFCLAGLLCGSAFAADAQAPAAKGEVLNEPHELKIGDSAPDFSLPGIDGKTHSLADYGNAKILVIAFISNHCPTSHGAEERMKKLIDDTKDKGVTFVAINPNNPDGLSIDELGYSRYNDGFDDMKKHAAEQKFNFPYLYDGETQAVAKAYGCLATPHVFIFDAGRKLRYKGHFDDSRFADAATVKNADARNAVEAMLAGKPVPIEVTKPHGCSTKWITKKAAVAARHEKFDKTPVEIAAIDAAGLVTLRKNDTKKLRLFNVWATWCAPCRAEFPELVTTSRKFGMRDFELITISVDDPKDEAKAKEFLEKQGAGLVDLLKKSVNAEGRTTNNYLFTGSDPSELMKALDPKWPGGYPHTVLVAPGGEVLWRHNGPVDGDDLRARILEFLGVYYKP